jgi:hypothetical protein
VGGQKGTFAQHQEKHATHIMDIHGLCVRVYVCTNTHANILPTDRDAGSMLCSMMRGVLYDA